jgi:hypothetical protein
MINADDSMKMRSPKEAGFYRAVGGRVRQRPDAPSDRGGVAKSAVRKLKIFFGNEPRPKKTPPYEFAQTAIDPT